MRSGQTRAWGSRQGTEDGVSARVRNGEVSEGGEK